MYKIGDFSKITGASIRTLRFYDDIDLFKPDEIDIYTNYRYYSEEKIEEFKIITELKNVGFSLDEIKKYWNKFDDATMILKKKELLNNIEDTKDKIKQIDYLRSKIVAGKFVMKELPDKHNNMIKKKTLNSVISIVKASFEQLQFQRSNIPENIYNGVLNGKLNYFVIYENNIIMNDFLIDDNELDIDINSSETIFYDKRVMGSIFKYLSKNYQYINLTINIIDESKIALAYEYGFIKKEVFDNKIKMEKNLRKEEKE